MKTVLLNNWNFMRIARTALGIAVIVQAAQVGNWTMGVLGILFTALPVLNIGCCATGTCNSRKKKIDSTKAITYEQVV
ncbi:MAG: hypothetical protein EAY75_16110 [Bacteroidetes bacterium]|nr:MAG: hypothetical protein EAY75_16110 [Bacteroidota bacterium]